MSYKFHCEGLFSIEANYFTCLCIDWSNTHSTSQISQGGLDRFCVHAEGDIFVSRKSWSVQF